MKVQIILAFALSSGLCAIGMTMTSLDGERMPKRFSLGTSDRRASAMANNLQNLRNTSENT
jgi:hypothetical protein